MVHRDEYNVHDWVHKYYFDKYGVLQKIRLPGYEAYCPRSGSMPYFECGTDKDIFIIEHSKATPNL